METCPSLAVCRSRVLYECAKLFEVQKSTPGRGGENPSHSLTSDFLPSICIDLCAWKECTGHSTLVLVCNNGYIILYILPTHGKPTIKQLKWYEGRQQHILAITLDPGGEWLACACLDGGIYLIPVISLTLECAPVCSYGVLNDVSVIQPSRKVASPTSIVWWDTMDRGHYCITGSEVGEITFFDLKTNSVVHILYVSGCIDDLLLASLTDSTTYLLIGLRGGEWKRILLEEHYHEAPDVSYADVTAKDFDVVLDDVVIKSFMDLCECVEPFVVKDFSIFSQLTHLTTQDWRQQHLLTSLNLTTSKLQAYSYNFDLSLEPLNTYQMVPGATQALLTDRLIYTISHADIVNPCSFTLSLLSTQRALVTELEDQGNAIIQQFTIPSPPDLIGFYSTQGESTSLLSHGTLQPTHLGGCIMITKTTVFQCKQNLCPDAMFLEMVLSSKPQERAEEFGITLKLDICGLYRIAAEKVLYEANFNRSLKHFELSRCSPQHIISSFAKLKKVPELVQYLHQAVYDDTGHASLGNTKQAQEILFRCFLHECLRLCGTPDGSMMSDKFSQFITDKFLYDQSAAMESLLKCGLKEQLFELAKAHNKLQAVLDMVMKKGCMDLSPSVQASLASRQYISTLSEAADGLYLYQMMPSTFIRFLITKPAIIPQYLNHLLTLLPKLDVPTLIRLANLFDPSHSTIRPHLIKAHFSRQRSHSTGSLMSVTDSVSSGGGTGNEVEAPRLEDYVEMFLTILIVLNSRRKKRPASSIMHLSTLNNDNESESYSEVSQWARGSVLSCGLHHAAMLVNGDLFTWGATKNGKLGHGDIEEEQKSMPLRVETFLMLNVHVLSVTCGAEHTIALCQEGIYSWGSSSHGQLGHGDTLKRTRPVQISSLADKGIVAVECGQYHSLALSDDHSVWSWGWGVHGQLGLQSVEEKLLPTHATLLDECKVSLISAGYGHSAVLTADGKVLTFGNGMYGQLGHGNADKQSAPKPVTALEGSIVYLLACGNFHTVAVTTDHQVHFWGKSLHRTRSSTGIKGVKEYKRSRHTHPVSPPAASTNAHSPQLMSDLHLDDAVVQVSCGSFHSLLLTAKGTVFSWGSNVHGQLGHPHIPEILNPTEVNQFGDQKVIAVGAGDEFSLAIDDRCHPWGWGRADNGQLGFESMNSRGGTEPVKQSVFKPAIIDALTNLPETSKPPREDSPSGDAPFLDIDLEWDLTDFATVGAPHLPYGRKALDTALVQLYGFYRTSSIVWRCQDQKDWESMATIYQQEQQWPQALECSIKALACHKSAAVTNRESVICLFQTYHEKLVLETTSYHTVEFVHKGLQMINGLFHHWESQSLESQELEDMLMKYLPILCFPLSLIIRNTKKCSFDFHLKVAKEVVEHIMNGSPKPEHFAIMSQEQHPTDTMPPKETTKEVLLSNTRLWAEVMRNLSKDVFKSSSILLTGSALSAFNKDSGNSTPVTAERMEKRGVIAFSCGHAFRGTEFESTILTEFKERVQNFPVPITETLIQLQNCYKKLAHYPLACPYCVFHYLRQLQLQERPEIPIKPWTQ